MNKSLSNRKKAIHLYYCRFKSLPLLSFEASHAYSEPSDCSSFNPSGMNNF